MNSKKRMLLNIPGPEVFSSVIHLNFKEQQKEVLLVMFIMISNAGLGLTRGHVKYNWSVFAVN